MAEVQAMGQDGASQNDGSDGDMSQGYTICIKVDDQGKISVGVEPASEQDGDADDNDEDYQDVPSFASAVKLAKEIYAHAGSLSDMSQANADMAAGYAGNA